MSMAVPAARAFPAPASTTTAGARTARPSAPSTTPCTAAGARCARVAAGLARWVLDHRQQLGGHRGHRNLVADVALDIRQADRILLAAEADGIALRSSARGASDAMHVIGRILRQIEVEHVADVGDVQAA